MSIRGKAFIVGSYEHPERKIPDKSVSQIHAEVCIGALKDAGLSLSDVDGLFYTGHLSMGATALSDYMGLNNLKVLDTTMTGGSSPVIHIGHAAMASADPASRPRGQPLPVRHINGRTRAAAVAIPASSSNDSGPRVSSSSCNATEAAPLTASNTTPRGPSRPSRRHAPATAIHAPACRSHRQVSKD